MEKQYLARIVYLIGISYFSVSLWAFDIKIEKNDPSSGTSAQVFFDGKNSAECVNISQHIAIMKEWVNTYDKKDCSASKLEITQNASSGSMSCRWDASSCLPEMVLNLLGKTLHCSGANCWNAVLMGLKISEGPVKMSGSSYRSFLQSSLCRPVASDDLRPGDIGAMSNIRNEVHGFIFVSPNLVFSKNGKSEEAPYSLLSLAKLEEVYKNDYGILEYFRCLSWHPAMGEILQPLLREMKDLVGQAECAMEEVYFRPTSGLPALHRLVDQWEPILKKGFAEQIAALRFFSSVEKSMTQILFKRAQDLLDDLDDKGGYRGSFFKDLMIFFKDLYHLKGLIPWWEYILYAPTELSLVKIKRIKELPSQLQKKLLDGPHSFSLIKMLVLNDKLDVTIALLEKLKELNFSADLISELPVVREGEFSQPSVGNNSNQSPISSVMDSYYVAKYSYDDESEESTEKSQRLEKMATILNLLLDLNNNTDAYGIRTIFQEAPVFKAVSNSLYSFAYRLIMSEKKPSGAINLKMDKSLREELVEELSNHLISGRIDAKEQEEVKRLIQVLKDATLSPPATLE